AERIRLLHQPLTGDDFDDIPVVFLVLHVRGLLAANDDDRANALVIFLAVVDFTDQRRNLLFLLVGLDDVRRIEALGFFSHAGPMHEADVGILRTPFGVIAILLAELFV